MGEFSTRGKGYISIPDGRIQDNWFMHPASKLSAAALPSAVDLTPYRPPVLDQGRVGACTGFAFVGAAMTTLAASGEPSALLSPSTAYRLGRALSRANSYRGGGLDPLQDLGADPNVVHLAAAKYGIPLASQIEGVDHPCAELTEYGERTVTDEPALIEMQRSDALKLVGSERIWSTGQQRIDDVCRALAAKFAVGISVYASDERYQGYVGGVMPPPPNGAWPDHMNYIDGCYTDATGHRIFYGVNSWGERWGGKGCYLAPEYILHESDCLLVASVRRQ